MNTSLPETLNPWIRCSFHRLFALLFLLVLSTGAWALVYEDKWTAGIGCCTFTPEGMYYPSAQQACTAALEVYYGSSEGKRCVANEDNSVYYQRYAGVDTNGQDVHGDHLGTPRLMTNELNKPVWQWPYSAFGGNKPAGALKATANPKAALTNRPVLLAATHPVEMNLGFPGQMRDIETGMLYNALRDTYDPNTGAYWQKDPIGLNGGFNRRGYANQNSLQYSDSSGLYSFGEFGDDASNAMVGFGDAFLFSILIRNSLNIEGEVDRCSTAYKAGEVVGTVWGLIPFALEEGAAYGATKAGMWLNRGRSWRIGPGRMPGVPAEGSLSALPAGPKVPRFSVGGDQPGVTGRPHIDLRSRLPKLAPVGMAISDCTCLK